MLAALYGIGGAGASHSGWHEWLAARVHGEIVDATGVAVRMAPMDADVALLAIEAARRAVLDHVGVGSVTTVPLRDATGRVLARPVVNDVDYPPFDKAMMDGYAVRAADVATACAAAPAMLRVVGQVGAGHDAAGHVGLGEAVQINTGAPVPPGADAVVPVENTELSADGSAVAVSVAVPAGKHIDARAKYVAAGSAVLSPGVRMAAGQIAAAAAAGAATVSVYARPRVAYLVTGDELVDVSERPRGPQIRNSNGPMLSSLICQAGGEPIDLGVVGDDRAALADRVREGLTADVLCISGGISMGAFDFVPEVLESCGVRTVFRKVAIKPGKPVLFGVCENGARVFGLPGNPSSGFVCFWLLVRPVLAALLGLGDQVPIPRTARLAGTCGANGNRQSYAPALLRTDEDGASVAERLDWHGSGDPFGLSRANAFIVRRPDALAAASGDCVAIIPLESL